MVSAGVNGGQSSDNNRLRWGPPSRLGLQARFIMQSQIAEVVRIDCPRQANVLFGCVELKFDVTKTFGRPEKGLAVATLRAMVASHITALGQIARFEKPGQMITKELPSFRLGQLEILPTEVNPNQRWPILSKCSHDDFPLRLNYLKVLGTCL